MSLNVYGMCAVPNDKKHLIYTVRCKKKSDDSKGKIVSVSNRLTPPQAEWKCFAGEYRLIKHPVMATTWSLSDAIGVYFNDKPSSVVVGAQVGLNESSPRNAGE